MKPKNTRKGKLLLLAPTIQSTLRAVETLVGPCEIIISGGAKGRAPKWALISFQMMCAIDMWPPRPDDGSKPIPGEQIWRRKLMCHKAELNFFVPLLAVASDQ